MFSGGFARFAPFCGLSLKACSQMRKLRENFLKILFGYRTSFVPFQHFSLPTPPSTAALLRGRRLLDVFAPCAACYAIRIHIFKRKTLLNYCLRVRTILAAAKDVSRSQVARRGRKLFDVFAPRAACCAIPIRIFQRKTLLKYCLRVRTILASAKEVSRSQADVAYYAVIAAATEFYSFPTVTWRICKGADV